MKYIGNAKTPTLVIHNQQDLRCAIEQSEQVFIALKKWAFPPSSLSFRMSRMGSPASDEPTGG